MKYVHSELLYFGKKTIFLLNNLFQPFENFTKIANILVKVKCYVMSNSEDVFYIVQGSYGTAEFLHIFIYWNSSLDIQYFHSSVGKRALFL